MAIGKFALQYGPFVALVALAFIVFRANPRQRVALGLAWAFPGAGHFWLGERRRGMLFCGCLVAVFIVGLALSEFASVSPLDRHKLWGLAQIPGGLLTLGTWLATMDVRIDSYDGIYQVGSLYVGTACLLNILAICDAWDIAGGHLPETDDEDPAESEAGPESAAAPDADSESAAEATPPAAPDGAEKN